MLIVFLKIKKYYFENKNEKYLTERGILCIVTQHSTAQHSTAQHSTAQLII